MRSTSVPTRVREALFRHDNFGPSWALESKPPPEVSCLASHPWRGALVRRWSPIYRSDYVAVQEIVAAFAGPRAAIVGRNALASAPAQRCFFRAVTRDAEAETPAADFASARALREDFPHPGVEATRAEMPTIGDVPPHAVYIDQIRARRRSYLADAVIISSAEPLKTSVYETLVDIVADRLRRAVG